MFLNKMTRKERLEKYMKDYYEMIGRVAEVDIKAAIWLREEAIHRTDFNYDGMLGSCFSFEDTPQGIEFWWSIQKAIGELL